jgi:branched-chain amino acid transport system permease protein
VEVATQIVIGGLLQGVVFAIIALGFSLVLRVTDVINLSQGGFCIVAAMATYTFAIGLEWPMPLAVVAAVAVTVALGTVVGALIFVPSISVLPPSSMLLVTAGLLTAIEGLCLVVWGSAPYTFPPFSGEHPIVLFGVRLPTQGLWIAGAAIAIISGFWYLIMRTSLGEALRACAENPTAARLMGIDYDRMVLFSFSLAVLIAAIGGVVVGPTISFAFDTGNFFATSGFIAVAIGGIGSFIGAIAGGLVLGVTQQVAAGYVSSLFSNGIALALLAAVLLVRPSGLFTSRRTRREDVRDAHYIFPPIVRLRGRGALLFGVIAIGVIAALPFVVPASWTSALVITLILFIAVLGLDVLVGYTGQISLGQAGFMAIGGYTAAFLATRYDWSPLAGTLAGIALSLVCALALTQVTMRLRGHYLALATLVFGLVIDSLSVGLEDITGGPSGLIGIPGFAIGPLDLDSPLRMYYFVAALAVLLVLGLLGGMRSSFGRALQTVRTDQTAAAALGINVPLYKMAAFAICATLASLAGSLYAFFFHYLSPEMVATPRSFELIAMLVIGGESMLVGSILGVALLTLLPTVIQPLALYKTLAIGLVLILVFRYLPGGIFGVAAHRIARRFAPQ